LATRRSDGAAMTNITRYVNVGPTVARKVVTGSSITINQGGGGGAQEASELALGAPIADLPGVADVKAALIELAKDIPVQKSFTQQDLSVAGVLPYVHGRDTTTPTVEVWNERGEVIYPDRVSTPSPNEIGVVLKSFEPIPGSWRVKVSRG